VSEEVLHIQLASTVLDRRCLPPWGGGVGCRRRNHRQGPGGRKPPLD